MLRTGCMELRVEAEGPDLPSSQVKGLLDKNSLLMVTTDHALEKRHEATVSCTVPCQKTDILFIAGITIK